MRIVIRDIAYHLPQIVVTNADLQLENPTWDMQRVYERSGVQERHIAREDETALDLALEACKKLFFAHPEINNSLDGIIFCTQSEDYIMPPNACILHESLKLADNVFAYDFNLACSGFIYGLAMANAWILSGMAKNILLVTADTYSRYIHKQDRSARSLFGDGAAATWIGLSESSEGIMDIQLATHGKGYRGFIIPAGGCRMPKSGSTIIPVMDESNNIRTLENIRMDGMAIMAFVNTQVLRQIRSILKKNNLTVNDIDCYIFHQASKITLDSLSRLLGIKPEKEYRNLDKIGNTVSASIPLALKDALDSGRISHGSRVLISGFGVGLSYGTAILEI